MWIRIFYSASQKDYIFIINSCIVATLIGYVFIFIIGKLINTYMNKQFRKIEDNGIKLNGEIVIARKEINAYKPLLFKIRTGILYVSANNEIYRIGNIVYNKEFELLEEKLNDNDSGNFAQITKLYQEVKEGVETNKRNRACINSIRIDIYVLDNKVFADLDSIRYNTKTL